MLIGMISKMIDPDKLFWELHTHRHTHKHTHTHHHHTHTSLSYFTNFAHLYLWYRFPPAFSIPFHLRPCFHIPPSHVSPAPSFSSHPLPLPSIRVSICPVWARLHGSRKGKKRASLNYTCSSSSAPTQSGPARCLPSRFTAFVSCLS